MDDKQLAKLIKKNVAKVAKARAPKPGRAYDKTLPPTRDADEDSADREAFFKEMKRREF